MEEQMLWISIPHKQLIGLGFFIRELCLLVQNFIFLCHSVITTFHFSSGKNQKHYINTFVKGTHFTSNIVCRHESLSHLLDLPLSLESSHLHELLQWCCWNRGRQQRAPGAPCSQQPVNCSEAWAEGCTASERIALFFPLISPSFTWCWQTLFTSFDGLLYADFHAKEQILRYTLSLLQVNSTALFLTCRGWFDSAVLSIVLKTT